MPSWKGVINDAQANALAAYILAGFPNTGATYDPDPAKAEDIYSAYACIDCHGQVGGKTAPSPAPNPKTADKEVPALRNPDDDVPTSELRSVLMEGSIPDPGTKGVIFMPAWGQILSVDQMNTDPAVHRRRSAADAAAGSRSRARRCRSRAARRRRRRRARRRRDDVLPAIVAQGIPLAPSLEVRLIALAVVEVVLLTTAVLLYIRWAQFKREPLDDWWERRKRAGFSPRTRALMDEEERERLEAEGAPVQDDGAGSGGGPAPQA